MAAKRGTRPATRSQLVTGTLLGDDAKATSRLLSDVGAAVQETSSRIAPRSQLIVDLAIGDNRINHGLGRKASGVTLGPTVADAGFAWSFAVDGDAVVVITIVGSAQPRAAVEVW